MKKKYSSRKKKRPNIVNLLSNIYVYIGAFSMWKWMAGAEKIN